MVKTVKDEIIESIHSLRSCLLEIGCYAEVERAMDMYADFRIKDLKKYIRHLEINEPVSRDAEIESMKKCLDECKKICIESLPKEKVEQIFKDYEKKH